MYEKRIDNNYALQIRTTAYLCDIVVFNTREIRGLSAAEDIAILWVKLGPLATGFVCAIRYVKQVILESPPTSLL